MYRKLKISALSCPFIHRTEYFHTVTSCVKHDLAYFSSPFSKRESKVTPTILRSFILHQAPVQTTVSQKIKVTAELRSATLRTSGHTQETPLPSSLPSLFENSSSSNVMPAFPSLFEQAVKALLLPSTPKKKALVSNLHYTTSACRNKTTHPTLIAFV